MDGRRVGAVILDGFALAPVLLGLGVLVGGVSFGSSSVAGTATAGFRETLGYGLVSIALTLSYFFVCETLWGQTLGKRACGLRVLRADGRRADPAAISARTVLRLLDALPGIYLVGALTMICTGQRRQRLGDLAARTVVTRATRQGTPAKGAHRNLLLFGYPIAWIVVATVLAVFVLGVSGGSQFVHAADRLCADGQRILQPGAAPLTVTRWVQVDAGVLEAHQRLLAASPDPGPQAAPLLASERTVLVEAVNTLNILRNGDHSHAATLRGLEHIRLAADSQRAQLRGLGYGACANSL